VCVCTCMHICVYCIYIYICVCVCVCVCIRDALPSVPRCFEYRIDYKTGTIKFKNEKLLKVSLYVCYNELLIPKLTGRLAESPGTLVDNHCIRHIGLKKFIIPGLISPPFCVWLLCFSDLLCLPFLLLFFLYRLFLETVLRIELVCSCLSPNVQPLTIE
jgi:hypothetical protein